MVQAGVIFSGNYPSERHVRSLSAEELQEANPRLCETNYKRFDPSAVNLVFCAEAREIMTRPKPQAFATETRRESRGASGQQGPYSRRAGSDLVQIPRVEAEAVPGWKREKLSTTLPFVFCLDCLCSLPSAALPSSCHQAAVVYECHLPPDTCAPGRLTLPAGAGPVFLLAESGS